MPTPPCATNPEQWWTTDDEHTARAVALCHTCPLRPACAAHALDTGETYGIWGGLTPTDRAEILHGPGWWIDHADRLRQPCGTPGAHMLHIRYGETCTTCTTAEAERTTVRRRAVLAEEHARVGGGSVRGYDTHRALGEPACAPCQRAKARTSARARRPAAA